MTDPRTSMLVVLDSDSRSQAPLAVADEYASHTVVLRSWSAPAPSGAEDVRTSTSAQPTISEALGLAAERGISWVGVRRSFMEPTDLLAELLVATAKHAGEGIPGFAVLLTDGRDRPMQRVLAIVNRSDGPISGLSVYAAVAVADVAGAHLDILVIGQDSVPRTEDDIDVLVINRERELFDAAIQRADDRGVTVTWITAESVTDSWAVVADQLGQAEYDLVIDDLGNVSLAKVRRRATIEEALATGATGALPLKLLTETTIPVLLVVDEIRLRWVPERMLRAGAVAAISLGVVGAAPLAATAAAPVPAATATLTQRDHDRDLRAQLREALTRAEQEAGLAEPGTSEQERAEAVAETSRGGTGDGARAQAQAAGTASPAVAPPGTQYLAADYAEAIASPSSASGATMSPKPVAPATAPKPVDTRAGSKDKDAKDRSAQGNDPKKDKKKTTKAPKKHATKKSVTPAQVDRARTQAAQDRAALQKDKEQKERTEEAVTTLQEELAEAEAAAADALTDLEVATATHAEAAERAEQTAAAASGVAALLPGAPTLQEVAAAEYEQQVAAEKLETAIEAGAQTLEVLEETAATLDEQKEKLQERRADVQDSREDLQESQEKAEDYRAALARTRQSPMAGGSYNLTARYGSGGGYWSSGRHTGLDFAAPSGTPVRAAASGTVVSTGYEGAYGNRVVIDHGNGYRTTYNHLSSMSVSPGQAVTTGDQIGRVGLTGNTTGAHLHFEVTKGGGFVNPEAWLGW